MEEKVLYGNLETKEENKVIIFRSEYNDLNTISGENIYAEIHNCWDTQKNYVDIEIDATFDKESLKFLMDSLWEFYNQMG